MKNISFVTRSDDAASSIAANTAIERVVSAGFIKNVSIMAPGAFVEDACRRFGKRADVCFGMHATLNAEWDRVKWKPLTGLDESSGLVDADGYFLPDPREFRKTKPQIPVILREYDAQLKKLRDAGFDIKYFDSHMMPEMVIEGLDDAIQDWVRENGLVDHMHFYKFPPDLERFTSGEVGIFTYLRSVPDGQYFFLIHPAVYGEEMLRTGNSQTPGETVAKQRDKEYRTYSSALNVWLLRHVFGIRPLRYDEAVPYERMSPSDFARIMGVSE